MQLPTDLGAWLQYIEALHPKTIAMGLGRVNEVIARLALNPTFPIITVAGTNGKGSTCAILEKIYLEEGYRVGCYTSPHLQRYNERVRINGIEAEDPLFCQAFSAVEQARNNTPLTYFEFGTLAAVWMLQTQGVEVGILEIGLGGRLDAVNAFEPSATIVTAIDMDHMDYLGDTREKIAFEKAGVFRPNVLAVCGDANPPQTLIHHARQVGADLRLVNDDYAYTQANDSWAYADESVQLTQLPMPALMGKFQLSNASAALCAVQYLQARLPVNPPAIQRALQQVSLAGRFQIVNEKPLTIVDVAHNPHAAKSLAENLEIQPCGGKTIAVFAMLADKDIQGVVAALAPQMHVWYMAPLDNPRGAGTALLRAILAGQVDESAIVVFDNVESAYRQACLDAAENDRIVVFGSFFTVADVLNVLQST